MTSVIGLPSTGLACCLHCLHQKLASGYRGPGISLHFLRTQLEQTPQKIKFTSTPLRHTSQETLLDFRSTLRPGPDIRTLVQPMLTRSPFPSIIFIDKNWFEDITCKLAVIFILAPMISSHHNYVQVAQQWRITKIFTTFTLSCASRNYHIRLNTDDKTTGRVRLLKPYAVIDVVSTHLIVHYWFR